MTERSAEGVRGTIIFDMPDGKPVFRVHGQPDPETGLVPHTDYALRVSDLRVEITSGYYRLYESEHGEEETPCVDYRVGGMFDAQ